MKSTGPFADARRALAVAVAGGFAVSAMACSAGGAPSQPTQPPAVAQPNAPQPAAAVNTPRLRISMITHAPPGDAFWDIIQTGAKDAAAKDNVEFLYSSDEDAGKQATLVQNAIDQKVDGIVVTLAKPADLLVREAIVQGHRYRARHLLENAPGQVPVGPCGLCHEEQDPATALAGAPPQCLNNLHRTHPGRIEKTVRRNLPRPIAANRPQDQRSGGNDPVKKPGPSPRPADIPENPNTLGTDHRCLLPLASI